MSKPQSKKDEPVPVEHCHSPDGVMRETQLRHRRRRRFSYTRRSVTMRDSNLGNP